MRIILCTLVAAIAAAPALATGNPTGYGVMWARAFDQAAYSAHSPIRITNVVCINGGGGTVDCKIATLDKKTGQTACGLIQIRVSDGRLLHGAALPAKDCFVAKVAKKSALAA